jgi:hypothetical protein
MASFLARGESHTYETAAVPASLDSNSSPQAIKGSIRQVAIASSSSDQQAGGLLLFNIPSQNASITRKSMFVRAKITMTSASTPPAYTSAALSTYFQGPGILQAGSLITTKDSTDTATSAFLPSLANAYSLIQRSTLFSGGAVLDQVNWAADLMSGLLLPHASDRNWLASSGNVMLAVAQPATPETWSSAAQASTFSWDVCLPVIHSVFNGIQDFPLYLMSGTPLSLQYDMTALTRAMKIATTAGYTSSGFTLSNAQLCFECVDLPAEFINSQRMAVKSNPFIIPQISYMNVQLPYSALASYTVGVNCSSVKGVFLVPFGAASYSSDPATLFNYNRAGFADYTLGSSLAKFTGTNFQVFADGRLVNSIQIDTPAMEWSALQQALNGSISNIVTGSVAKLSTYLNNHFALGLDLTCYNDESTVLSGTPASQLTISLTNAQANSTFLVTVIISYDSLLLIGENGAVEVKR